MKRASDSNVDRSVTVRDGYHPGQTPSTPEAVASAGGTTTSTQSRVDGNSPSHRTAQRNADRTSLAKGLSISQLPHLQEYSHFLESSIRERTDDGDFIMISARERPEQQMSKERGHTRGKNAQTAYAEARYGLGKKLYAKVDTRDAFPLRHLVSARRRSDGGLEFEVEWETSWVGLEDLEGEEAIEMAKQLAEPFCGEASVLGYDV